MSPVYVLTLFVALAAITWSSATSLEVSERFLEIDFPVKCNDCYECLCHHKCPGGHWLQHNYEYNCPKQNYYQDCNVPLGQKGEWATWSTWSVCLGTCDAAKQNRSRSCSNPAPKNCGAGCDGSGLKEQLCVPNGCHNSLSTAALAETTTTTTKTTTLPSTTQTTSKPTPVVSSPCSKFCAVASVAQNHTATASEATTCPDGQHDSSEALPIQCCQLNASTAWIKGNNVLLRCHDVPTYSPIARYSGDKYIAGTAGIFVNCLDNGETGFRFIHQTCDKVPELVHLTTTNPEFGPQDVINYFTIVV